MWSVAVLCLAGVHGRVSDSLCAFCNNGRNAQSCSHFRAPTAPAAPSWPTCSMRVILHWHLCLSGVGDIVGELSDAPLYQSEVLKAELGESVMSSISA